MVSVIMAMYSNDAVGAPVWTYRVESGVCTDSLAYVTAAKFNIPPAIVERAKQLSAQFDASRRQLRNNSLSLPPITVNTLQSFLSSVAETIIPQLTEAAIVVPHNYNPPPVLMNASCIYILLIQPSNNTGTYLYVGESESLAKRLARHRLVALIRIF